MDNFDRVLYGLLIVVIVVVIGLSAPRFGFLSGQSAAASDPSPATTAATTSNELTEWTEQTQGVGDLERDLPRVSSLDR